MYVCMYIIYIHIYIIYIHICVYKNTYVCIYINMCIYICIAYCANCQRPPSAGNAVGQVLAQVTYPAATPGSLHTHRGGHGPHAR